MCFALLQDTDDTEVQITDGGILDVQITDDEMLDYRYEGDVGGYQDYFVEFSA